MNSNNPMARVMSLRDFRLLFAGASTSLLGDQFTLIATPWLVLKLTNDPMALGIVLALEVFHAPCLCFSVEPSPIIFRHAG